MNYNINTGCLINLVDKIFRTEFIIHKSTLNTGSRVHICHNVIML